VGGESQLAGPILEENEGSTAAAAVGMRSDPHCSAFDCCSQGIAATLAHLQIAAKHKTNYIK